MIWTRGLRAATWSLALGLTTGPAFAQRSMAPADVAAAGPVATAPSRADEAQTARQIQAFVDDGPAPIDAAESPWRRGLYTSVAPGEGAVDAMADVSADPGVRPRQMHGEVSATVGTHGLRAGSAAVVLPIGEDATLGLAISSAHYGR